MRSVQIRQAVALCAWCSFIQVSPAWAADPASRNAPAGCLASGNGYLRAQVRGALNLDIDWRNRELQCDGSPRPDGSGVRVSFAGPQRSDGRRVRLVFGIGRAKEGAAGQALPTNLTVILEGERRLFATRGEDKCTIDELQQERLGALGGAQRSYRIVARGFCIEPASSMDNSERILVSRFDFAGGVTFGEAPLSLEEFPRTAVTVREGRHRFNAWVADSPQRQMQGLMYVRELAPDQGMLFVHPKPRIASMWMKNTYIELDMLFIDAQGRIVKIYERTTPLSLTSLGSGVPVQAVLEIKGGEAARRGLRIGQRVSWSAIK